MFGFGKKKETIFSPINGEMIALEEVPDKVFAEKMMGEGVGFILNEKTIYSPCEGTISMIAETKHAIGFITKQGLEILLHIGLDTVALNGKGFTMLKVSGETVQPGEPIIQLDLELLKDAGIDLTTPMVFTNGSEFQLEQIAVPGPIRTSDTIVMNTK